MGLQNRTEPDANRLVSFLGKFVHADELATLIPSSKFKAVTVRFPNDEFRTSYIYSYVTKLNHVSHKVRVTVCVGHWDSQDPKCVHILISNHIAADPLSLINSYLLRWGIECIFRDLKEHCAFDHYQTRSILAIARHWHLAVLAYSFLLWSKLNGGYLARPFTFHATALSEYLPCLRILTSVQSSLWAAHHPDLFCKLVGLKHPSRRAD